MTTPSEQDIINKCIRQIEQKLNWGSVDDWTNYDFEKLSDNSIVGEAMRILKDMFGNNIPNPSAIFRTKWAEDPYSFGSYSYIPVGASGQDYDMMAEPVANKLFFAGEATHRQFPGQTHGAYLSGMREAERIMSLCF